MRSKTESLLNVARITVLEINFDKTKTPKANTDQDAPLLLGAGAIEDVQEFKSLSSIVRQTGGADDDVKTRTAKAFHAFTTLRPCLRNENIDLSPKLRVFNSNIKSVLLYASKTWGRTTILEYKLQVFIDTCLSYASFGQIESPL